MPKRDDRPTRITSITGTLDLVAGLGPIELPDEIAMEIGGRVTTWLADTPERRAAGKLAAAARDALGTLEESYEIDSDRRCSIRLLKDALAAINDPAPAEGR
jgi:hypothetical protein